MPAPSSAGTPGPGRPVTPMSLTSRAAELAVAPVSVPDLLHGAGGSHRRVASASRPPRRSRLDAGARSMIGTRLGQVPGVDYCSSGTASGVSAGTGELLPFSVHRGHPS